MRAFVHQGHPRHRVSPDRTGSRTVAPAASRLPHRIPLLQRAAHSADPRGNQAVQRWLRARVEGSGSRAEDADERAADSVAAAVMRMPDDRLAPAPVRGVARQIDPRDFAGSQPLEKTDEEAVRPLALHRQSATGAGSGAAPIDPAPSVDRACRDGGRPLPADTRQFMESRFGADFAGVRIHTDRAAGDLAWELQARAFTTGHSIFFAPGEFQPGHPSGQHLLAHELTHVIQQRQGHRGADRAIQRQKGGCLACRSYCGYDTSRDLESYNCSGLSRRTYDYPDLATAKAAISTGTNIDCADTCLDMGMVKHWFWEYDSHLEDSRGQVLYVFDPDFHTVSGPTAGDPLPKDSDECYSKDGKRKVHGPGTGPSFRPPARAQVMSNDPSEKPGTDGSGRPIFKVCSVTAESCYCLPCPKAPARPKSPGKKPR